MCPLPVCEVRIKVGVSGANKRSNQLKTHSDYHVVTAESLFIHKTIDIVHQTETRKRA